MSADREAFGRTYCGTCKGVKRILVSDITPCKCSEGAAPAGTGEQQVDLLIEGIRQLRARAASKIDDMNYAAANECNNCVMILERLQLPKAQPEAKWQCPTCRCWLPITRTQCSGPEFGEHDPVSRPPASPLSQEEIERMADQLRHWLGGNQLGHQFINRLRATARAYHDALAEVAALKQIRDALWTRNDLLSKELSDALADQEGIAWALSTAWKHLNNVDPALAHELHQETPALVDALDAARRICGDSKG